MSNYTEIADRLFEESKILENRAQTLRSQAIEIYRKQSLAAFRKQEDRVLNRKEALELLWFNSYPALREWEDKVKPLGYLPFRGNTILRSEVLRFRDDYMSGELERKLNPKKRRTA